MNLAAGPGSLLAQTRPGENRPQPAINAGGLQSAGIRALVQAVGNPAPQRMVGRAPVGVAATAARMAPMPLQGRSLNQPQPRATTRGPNATRRPNATVAQRATVAKNGHRRQVRPVAPMRPKKVVSRAASALTPREREAVFRLGVSLITHGQRKVSDVALRLCIQPQEPRSLVRYKKGILVGKTNYREKFQDLKLDPEKLPALARHFFPDGIDLNDTPYSGFERDVGMCPPPARAVGEEWSGSNGNYRCIAHAPCGCPNRNGFFAVIEKVANRRKRPRCEL